MDVDKHKIWLFFGIAVFVIAIGFLVLESEFSFTEGFAGQGANPGRTALTNQERGFLNQVASSLGCGINDYSCFPQNAVALNNNVNQLTNQKNALEGDISNALSSLNNANLQIFNKNEIISTLNEDKSALTLQTQIYSNQVLNLESGLASATANIQSLENSLDLKDNVIEDLKLDTNVAVSNLEGKITLLNDNLKIKNSDLAILQSNLDVLNNNLLSANNNFEKVSAKLNTVQINIEGKNKIIADITVNNNKLSSQIATITNQVNTLTNENADLLNQNEGLQSSLQQNGVDSELMVSLQSQVSGLTSSNSLLNSQIATVNAEKSNLNNELITANNDILSLNEQNFNLNADLLAEINIVNTLNNDISNLNIETSTLTNTIATLTSDITNKDQQIATQQQIITDNGVSNDLLTSLQLEKTDLLGQVSGLSTSLDLKTNLVSDLQLQIDGHNAIVNTLNNDLLTYQTQSADYNSQVSDLQTENAQQSTALISGGDMNVYGQSIHADYVAANDSYNIAVSDYNTFESAIDQIAQNNFGFSVSDKTVTEIATDFENGINWIIENNNITPQCDECKLDANLNAFNSTVYDDTLNMSQKVIGVSNILKQIWDLG
jgi:chromosome segregation ATPase